MTQTVKNMVGLMGWAMPEQGYRKGPWTPEEDQLLSEYVTSHGEGRWSSVARCAGLSRSGKSCRLRWVNYLRPGLKRGQITPQEEGIITELHALWGNKWSTIARYLPGRTDNEIKNYWRTHFKKKEKSTRKSFERKKSQNPKPPKPLLPKPQELEAKQPQIERTNNILLPQQFPTTPDQQELTFMYANMCTSDLNEHDLSSPWIEDATCHNQDGLWWDRLWDFDDHGSVADQIHQDEYCSKIASSAHNHVISTNYNINNSINNNNNNNHDYNIQSNNAFHLLGRGSKPFVQ